MFSLSATAEEILSRLTDTQENRRRRTPPRVIPARVLNREGRRGCRGKGYGEEIHEEGAHGLVRERRKRGNRGRGVGEKTGRED